MPIKRCAAVRLAMFSLMSLSLLALADPASGQDRRIDFRDVRPILSDKCFKCHGPDEGARQGEFRLDRRADAEEALSPNAPAESEVLRRITSGDPDERMPPPDSKRSLTKRQIETLKLWIKQGAPYEKHWSFRPIVANPPPKVANPAWSKSPVDRFLYARMKLAGLTPAKPATRERLIRRLTFDLTGLPPTLKEIDAYLADKSNNADEKLVDRLLVKNSYGERMATMWLDASRYSDTYGYQVDRDRRVWPWRDWVIRSFNENTPYDRFAQLQLAGDLFPDATDDQTLATAFNRLHPQKVEGGSVNEEFRVEYVADRNHTFATAFLGLTLECCRCHDHKYDPISQKEYYQLFAFFNNIDESGLYSYFTPSVPTPTLLLTSDQQKANIDKIEKNIAAAERALLEVSESQEKAFEAWLDKRPAEATIAGQIAHQTFEDHKGGANASVEGKVGKAIQLSGDDAFGLKVGNFARHQPFSIGLWLKTPKVMQRAVVIHRSRAWTDAGSRGYQVLIEEGKLSASLIHFWPGNAIRVRTKQAIPVNQWLHFTMTYDGSSRADGLRLYVGGAPAESEVVRDNLYKNITGGGGDNLAIGARFRDRGFTRGMVDELRVFDRRLAALEVAHLSDGKRLSAALAKPKAELNKRERELLLEVFRLTGDEEHRGKLAALRAAREQRGKAVDGLSEIMVMREMSKRRPTFLLKRGAYNAPGERVRADTPAAFPAFPADQPRNRMGLARWLTDAKNPLTARVAVNRFWQMMFGAGLVRSPEDFGSQGEPPTHPELLDWLADDFIKNGWNVKRLLKMIAVSNAYRQSSIAADGLAERDPDNLYLSRAPRYRLSAEMIRDNALAVSGLMIDRVGGPPVKPYEVAVSFKPVGRDKGAGLYRRSLYTYWKRTAPAPVMMSLDASKRDICVVKRERTSSPLQALVLLNGPQFVESARVLAQRLIERHGEAIEPALVELFRRLTSRRPEGRELKIIRRLFDEQLEYFQGQPEGAAAFLKVGDAPRNDKLPAERVAALGVVANALMNYDACVTKR